MANKIYKDKICGYQLEYVLTDFQLGIKREDEINFQYFDFKKIGFDFVVQGTTLGIKLGWQDDYSFIDVGGAGLQFTWDGTKLGVRVEGETNYSFQDLRGASFQYEWQGTKLGIKTTDETSFTFVDLKGEPGNPNILSLGSVEMVDFGEGSIEITGSSPAQILNFKLPCARPTVFEVGNVIEGPAGVTISGTAPNQVLHFSLPRGKGIEYMWDGTKLGVRIEGDSQYVYTDLKGAPGDVSTEQLNAAIATAKTEINNEVNEKLSNLDTGVSLPLGAIINYPKDVIIPDGFCAEGATLLADEYPELTALFGGVLQKVDKLDIALENNQSNAGFVLNVTTTDFERLASQAFVMFDADDYTALTLLNSDSSTKTFQFQITGNLIEKVRAYMQETQSLKARIKATLTNNEITTATCTFSFAGAKTSFAAGSFEIIEKDFVATMVCDTDITEKMDLIFAISVPPYAQLDIYAIEFLTAIFDANVEYVKLPYRFSSVGPTTAIMYIGEKNGGEE